jgi:cytochrome c
MADWPQEEAKMISRCLTFVCFLAATFALPAHGADPAKGRELFTSICAKCHSLDPAEVDKRGPHLSGLFERRYGSVEGFPYRMVWPDADPLWTKKDLNSYLEIHRIPEADQRADIIEYLFEATRN